MKKFYALLGVFIVVLVSSYYLLDPERKELNDAERERLGGLYINLSNGITHYKLEGQEDGRLVVLVHGGTVPLWTWDNQVRSLKEQGYRTLRYDMYGRGYSDRPDILYDQHLYRTQLLELVDKLGFEQPFDLIGYSLGGAIATIFTAYHPEKVRKLVLISPLINNFKVPFFVQIPILGEFITRVVGVQMLTKRFVSLLNSSQDVEKYLQLFKEQTTYKGFHKSLLSMLRNNAICGDYNKSYQEVGNQDKKVFLIWGNKDKEINQRMISEIRSFIPDIEYKPVDGAGHGIVFQNPDVINDLISNFLIDRNIKDSK